MKKQSLPLTTSAVAAMALLLHAVDTPASAEGGSPVPVLTTADVSVRVDADKVLVERPQSLIGANIEDLNFQLYGGLYSQLLHGECFEEHVDPSEILGLDRAEPVTIALERKTPGAADLTGAYGGQVAVWVVLDEKGQPVLRVFHGDPFVRFPVRHMRRVYEAPGLPDWSSSTNRDTDRISVGNLTFTGGTILPSELPNDQGRRLVELASGDRQVSRHWRPVQRGSASGKFTLIREGVWTGKQAQRIEFSSGSGEVGIDNAGLFRAGLHLVGGKPYEGLLRIRCKEARRVWISLRDADGQVLAEQALDLANRPDEYQRLNFTLTSRRTTTHGRFALTLKQPGVIIVDYAFLQPGEWGRFMALPVRKDLAEAIVSMGVKTMRYNGAMVSCCPDGAEIYKWKQMIAPRDERQPYHGAFNPYASHGFTIFDFVDFCEAAGIMPVVGLRRDETEHDMADLVEYCKGGPDTPWGKRRIENGHPKPYLLSAVEIGNESWHAPSFKSLASALWAKDPKLIIVASANVGARPETNGRPAYTDAMLELARWLKSIGKEEQFVLDSHYGSRIEDADTRLDTQVGLRLHQAVAQEMEGFRLRLWPMEENGERCDWTRGLAHAHNLNAMNRMPACVERSATANTLQAWQMFLIWNQGRIHFTPSQIIFQPSYYVDRLYADEWLPLVVQAESSLPTLDVLAKKDAAGNVLTVYLVNIAPAPVKAALNLDGFNPRHTRVTQIHSTDMKTMNTPVDPCAIVPVEVQWKWDGPSARIDLPATSLTSIRLEN